jgi:hypothetical protein
MLKKLLLILVILFTIPTIYIFKKHSSSNLNHIGDTPRQSGFTTPASPHPSFIPQSILSFTPENLNINPGETIHADISISSPGIYPSLIQLELAYDPEVISQISITQGDSFQNSEILLNENNQKTGRISYALSQNETPKSGLESATVAKLTIKTDPRPHPGHTSIYFLPKTTILSENTNITLKSTNSLLISINPPLPSASQIISTTESPDPENLDNNSQL